MKDRKLTSLAGLREITWEIGTAELQRSVMLIETYQDLLCGVTNVEHIRNGIRIRRKLFLRITTGLWASDPSNRFVNEHAWVLSLMNQWNMTTPVNRQTKKTSLKPGAEAILPRLHAEMLETEPRVWAPDDKYEKAPAWYPGL